MLREELSEEKRKEYDILTAKMMGDRRRTCKAAGDKKNFGNC